MNRNRIGLTLVGVVVVLAALGAGAKFSGDAGYYLPDLQLVVIEAADGSIDDFSAGLYEVTNRQYAAFLADVGRGSDGWFATYGTEPGNLPARGMKKADAVAFCRWLTHKCRERGLIGENQTFNLPTDQQFTAMIGQKPGAEQGGKPEERMKQSTLGSFIHGLEAVPPLGGANVFRKGDASRSGEDPKGFDGTSDGYVNVAPVGRFRPANQRLFDIEGNVSELIREAFNDALPICARGGSYNTVATEQLYVSYRGGIADAESVAPDRGFRVVLESLAVGL